MDEPTQYPQDIPPTRPAPLESTQYAPPPQEPLPIEATQRVVEPHDPYNVPARIPPPPPRRTQQTPRMRDHVMSCLAMIVVLILAILACEIGLHLYQQPPAPTTPIIVATAPPTVTPPFNP